MKLRFLEKDIEHWAQRYEIPKEETELMNLKSEIQNAKEISKDQLRKVARWKATRSAGYIERNDEAFIREITTWSFSAKEERSKIEVLTLLDGVQWPTASVILHLFHEAQYPILDFRALESLEEKEPNQYTFEFWWKYVEFCRNIAKQNSVDMRTLDRALWQYSKDN